MRKKKEWGVVVVCGLLGFGAALVILMTETNSNFRESQRSVVMNNRGLNQVTKSSPLQLAEVLNSLGSSPQHPGMRKSTHVHLVHSSHPKEEETQVSVFTWVHSEGPALQKVPPAAWYLSDGSVSQSEAREGNNHKDLTLYPSLIAIFSRNFLKLQVQWNFKLILSAQMHFICSLGHTSYRQGNKMVIVRETSKFLSHSTGRPIMEFLYLTLAFNQQEFHSLVANGWGWYRTIPLQFQNRILTFIYNFTTTQTKS